jgi:peptidoglycan/LPS O-acetylase OafA/YrhL
MCLNTLVTSTLSTIDKPLKEAGVKHSAAIESRQFAALDGFRIFAIFAIVIYHCRGVLGYEPPVVVNLAGCLVGYFFVLSGFILAYQYPHIANAPQYFRYMGSRVARIWPTAVACLLLTCYLNRWPLYDHTKYWPALVSNFFLLQSWVPDRNYFLCFNAPAWTLSVDMFLYLLLPAALVCSKRPVLFVAGALITSFAASTAAYHAFPNEVDWCWAACPVTRVLEFALGVVAFELYKHSKPFSLKKSLLWEGGILLFWTALAVGFSTAQQGSRMSLEGIDLVGFWTTKLGGHYMPSLAFTAMIIVMAHGQGILHRLFSARPMVLLAKVSCSLYLIHFSLIVYFRSLSQGISFPFDPLLFAAAIAAIVGASVIMYMAVEEPARKWMNKSLDDYCALKFPDQTVRRKPLNNGFITARSMVIASYKQKALIFAVALCTTFLVICFVKTKLSDLKIKALMPTPLSEMAIEAALPSCLPAPRHVRFASGIELNGAKIDNSVQNQLRFTSYWHCLKDSKPARLAVHLIDANNKIVNQLDHDLLRVESRMATNFSDTITINPAQLKNAKSIGLALIEGGEVVKFERDTGSVIGLSDWGDKRLLIVIPTRN